VPVVFDPRVASGMVGHLLGAINGNAIARGTSFLKDKMGEQIFAPGIRIVDDPLRPRGLRSRPFDAEGLPTRQWDIVADGRLQTWLLDLRSARQLKLKSTGHASRGTGGPPSPSSTNVYLEKGKETPEALIGAVESGLYVTDMIGMGVNMITGDYSRGANGFWIEQGKLAFPVSEITIAGNLKDMFKAMVPANDLVFRQGVDAPTLRIDGMTVAGA
jgi:PmbA protein